MALSLKLHDCLRAQSAAPVVWWPAFTCHVSVDLTLNQWTGSCPQQLQLQGKVSWRPDSEFSAYILIASQTLPLAEDSTCTTCRGGFGLFFLTELAWDILRTPAVKGSFDIIPSKGCDLDSEWAPVSFSSSRIVIVLNGFRWWRDAGMLPCTIPW